VGSTPSPPEPALRRPAPGVVPAALAVLTVLAQIAYPLSHGDARTAATIVAVVLFFSASVSHAWVWRGPRAAVVLVAVTAGLGLAAEAIGVRTGFPFGRYEYRGTLGASLLSVPLVVVMAWTMMGYPALLVARRVARRRAAVAAFGALALVAWDLFLDPQMVDAGHWVWQRSDWPRVVDIPLSNFIGWFGVALVMMVLLDALVPVGRGVDDRIPYALFVWTYLSEVMGHAVFFGRPSVALVGGLAMGAVTLVFLRAVATP
jgi:uncharacterized membrane protein